MILSKSYPSYKRFLNVFTVCIAISVITGCGRGEPAKILLNRQSPVSDNPIVLQSKISFELDSITGPKIQCLQYHQNPREELLIFLNEETGVLYLSDYHSKKIISRITIEDNNKNHKKKFQGFYYHNRDSIFLFHFSPTVSLINSKGKIIKQYGLIKNPKGTLLENLPLNGFYSSSTNQGFYSKDTLYLNSVVLGGNKIVKKKIQILLNTRNGTVGLREMEMPKIYRGHNLGNSDYNLYSTAFNPLENKIIYSFPADENLIVRNIHSSSKVDVFANSTFVHFINEYSTGKYKNEVSDPMIEHFMTSASFGNILYDRFRNRYYRIVFLPVNTRDLNYEEKNSPLKQLSIITLDQRFRYLGEIKLPESKFQMYSAFVSKEGLNIQDRPVSDKTLDFTVLKISFLK
jgi:hypothetical protein